MHIYATTILQDFKAYFSMHLFPNPIQELPMISHQSTYLCSNRLLSLCCKPGKIHLLLLTSKIIIACEAGAVDAVPDLDGYYFSYSLWDGSDYPTGNTCCDNSNQCLNQSCCLTLAPDAHPLLKHA